jgi:serine protease AprX
MRSRPGWRVDQGLCPVCAQDAADALARGRSGFSLHTRTEPHTTFPYYHPDEEVLLGLPERLADAYTFSGQGVTLSFLDSGFYPHPDLSSLSLPQGVAWERLSPAQWRTYLEAAAPRLADYVDLTNGHRAQGLALASLWDGEGVAWHGEMTTAVAAGNGAMSGGRYRGFAPNARVLAIKVGRGDGRIPERDILAGMQWLLEEERWARYGVRVLNVSIGGDFDQPWQQNPVCLAAEALSARGVLVVAAAGNRAAEILVAPAQAPSVLTVGGVDDGNRAVAPLYGQASSHGYDALALYHHNFGVVRGEEGPQRKPDLLAPAAWIPGPILPISPILREAYAIDRLRRTLRGGEDDDIGAPDPLVAHWQRVLAAGPTNGHGDDAQAWLAEDAATGEWMGEVWQAVRRRMNVHKWAHAAYQHVDGTSVAAAVVSSVAAQMVQANSSLTQRTLRRLLAETALPLRHLPAEKQGAGLVQPAAAVAAALRAQGGPLVGWPTSGTVLSENELRKVRERVTFLPHAHLPHADAEGGTQPLYFGLYAPAAQAVALTGTWDNWQALQPLTHAGRGWWHGVLPLIPGQYAYRFWVEAGDAPARWLPDPESTHRIESGYVQPHSVVTVTSNW